MEASRDNAPDWLFCKCENGITQLSQAINSPLVPTAVGKCKISIEKNK